ncbi:MAG: glycosyltransferase family 2 protein [Fluviibacter sp.]
MNIPKVSIVIPTYRRPMLLKQAIESAIGQQVDFQYEIVIVDNESSYEWSCQVDEVLKGYLHDERIKLVRNNANIGMFGNWNKCIQCAAAEWITILNDDDLLMKNCLSKMWEVVQAQECNLIAVRNNYFGSRAPIELSNSPISKALKNIHFFCTNKTNEITALDMYLSMRFKGGLGVFFRKELALSIGCFDMEFFPSSDYKFFSTYINKFGPAYMIDEVCCSYRWEDNESLNIQTKILFVEKDFLIREGVIKSIQVNKFVRSFLLSCNYLIKRVQIANHSIQCKLTDKKSINEYFGTSCAYDYFLVKYGQLLLNGFVRSAWICFVNNRTV